MRRLEHHEGQVDALTDYFVARSRLEDAFLTLSSLKTLVSLRGDMQVAFKRVMPSMRVLRRSGPHGAEFEEQIRQRHCRLLLHRSFGATK